MITSRYADVPDRHGMDVEMISLVNKVSGDNELGVKREAALGGLSRGTEKAALRLSTDSTRAHRVTGSYEVKGGTTAVTMTLIAPDAKREALKVTGPNASIIESIIRALLEWARKSAEGIRGFVCQ